MPSELTGLSSVDRAVPPAAGSVGKGDVAPSYALTRIAPVEPRPGVTPTSVPVAAPLGRSGLDLIDLLTTTDVVATRSATGPVALEVGLEQARGALLRNLPGDALAALDGVWAGARRTEEGWYLRSGALTVLGLPGESERVAEEGLNLRPQSLALRFVQSVARFALGDVAGAKAVLQPALLRAPTEPVLQVQQALVEARQGDVPAAEALLKKLDATLPDHPAVAWGRAALRTLVADATRQRSRPTPTGWPATNANDAPDVFGDTITTALNELRSDSAQEARGDVAASALERFGARVAMREPADVAREARMLMRAFSAGGTLASATSAEQGHAARVVLTTFLAVATGERADTPTPLRTMVEQLVPLLQQGRGEDAERLVRRQSALAREPIGRLLLAVVRGALPEGAPVGPGRVEPTPARGVPTPTSGFLVVRGEAERGPVVPVRLGLGLLEESPAMRAAMERNTPAWSVAGLPRPVGDDRLAPFGGAAGMPVMTTDAAGVPIIANAETSLAGWGAAQAAADAARVAELSEGASMRAVALVCVALAAGALVTGHGVIAIGLAAGAVWLGLRRSSAGMGGHRSDRDGVGPHDGGSSQ